MRGRGGTVYRRSSDGRWVAAWTEHVDGRAVRRARYARTRTEARRLLRDALDRIDAGKPSTDSRTPFATFAERWAATTLRVSGVKPSTQYTYRRVLDRRVLPALGHRPLGRVTATDVEAMLVGMADEGLSAESQRLALTVTSKVLDAAVRDGLLARSPADGVRRPQPGGDAGHYLTPAQVRKVADACGPDLEPLVTLLAHTGLRVGEARALTWDRVDLDKGTVRVVGTLGASGTVGSTKTRGSRRAVPLTSTAVASLTAWKARQDGKRAASLVPWPDEHWVFTTSIGTPLDHANALKALKAAGARAGVPGVTFRALRHSAATVLLEQGVPMRVVSELLGHSSTRVTADIYSHVTARLVGEAASALERGYADAVLSDSAVNGDLEEADDASDLR